MQTHVGDTVVADIRKDKTMLQTTRYPVTLYTSEDEGAPKLSVNAGSFKTVLKACLVTGYGNKPGAGWEILFEEANKIALKSTDPKSPGFSVHISDNAGYIAALSLWENSTGIEAGRLIAPRRFINYVSDIVEKWLLAACARGFVFVSLVGDRTAYFYVSDFPSFAATDNSATIFVAQGGDSPSYSYISYSPAGLNGTGSDERSGRIARSFDGLRTGVTAQFSTAAKGSSHINITYPSPITGGFEAHPCFIVEDIRDNERGIRGILPGVVNLACNRDAIPFGASFDNIDGSSDTWVFIKLGSAPVLINITAWDI